eukprot:jgi/Botrbrau1/8390/Bobra.0237s0012.1
MNQKVEKQHEQEAEAFVRKRFVSLLEAKEADFSVEIVKFMVDSDSISDVICKRAEELNAVAVVIASHNKSTLSEFFLGKCLQQRRPSLQTASLLSFTEITLATSGHSLFAMDAAGSYNGAPFSWSKFRRQQVAPNQWRDLYTDRKGWMNLMSRLN